MEKTVPFSLLFFVEDKKRGKEEINLSGVKDLGNLCWNWCLMKRGFGGFLPCPGGCSEGERYFFSAGEARRPPLRLPPPEELQYPCAIVGPLYIVTPAPTYEIEAISDDFGRTELNVQLFHGLSRALSLLDQGLVCSSICDTGKMKDVEFQCFYVLQPSDRGTMLLRMLAASEEIWPIPETVSLNDITLSKEVEESIQASLSKVELKDYNPVLHERGFHQKVNLLVKESLQFGSIPVEKVARSPELRTSVETDVLLLEKSSMTEISQEEIQPISKREQQIPVTQDWEELIFISDAKKNCTPLCIAKSKFDELNLSSHSKPMDEKTSRILERLEGPKLKASKQAMGTLPFSTGSTLDESIKKPLDTATVSPKISQPLKPSFQRLKRKQR